METLLKASIFKLFLILFPVSLLNAQDVIEERKLVNEYYQVKPNTTVEVFNKYGNTMIQTGNDMNVNVKVEISVSGWNKKEILLTLKNINTDIKEEEGKLIVNISSDIIKWITINDKSKIKFGNGESASIENLYIDCVISMPKSLNLAVSSNYNDIMISDIDGNVEVDLVSGNLECAKIGGNLKLNLQYGDAEIQSMKNGELIVFDSELEMLEAADIQLNCQYSDIEIGTVNTIKLDSKDCDFSFGTVEKIHGNDMYSELEANNINTIEATIYDCDYAIQYIEKMNINAQYSSFEIVELNALMSEVIKNCEIEIDRLDVLIAKSAYSGYSIETLRKKIELNSNDDEINIASIKPEIESLTFTGRYTEYDLNFAKNTAYSIVAELKYSEIEIPEDKLAISEFLIDDEYVRLKAQTKAKTKETLPQISFSGNDCEIDIDFD